MMNCDYVNEMFCCIAEIHTVKFLLGVTLRWAIFGSPGIIK